MSLRQSQMFAVKFVGDLTYYVVTDINNSLIKHRVEAVHDVSIFYGYGWRIGLMWLK